MLDESGNKHYAASDVFQNGNEPFISVMESTLLSQFRIIPPNVVTVEKSQDGHFLVSANEIGQSASIQLMSLDSLKIITSTRISVKSNPNNSLYIVDLIVHCVDALIMNRGNLSAYSIGTPREYELLTVSLSMDTQRFPCCLLVFLVFNDRSIERVSSFDHNHYQMYLVDSHHQSESSPSITDGQLIAVKWTKNSNISLFESSNCMKSKVIFSKQMNWSRLMPLVKLHSVTEIPINKHAQVTTPRQINWKVYNTTIDSSNYLLQISLYIIFAFLACFFLCLIIFKAFCSKSRSRTQSMPPTCYNISDSVFLNEHNKIRHSNSKSFSSLGKCSANCIKTTNGKSRPSEPYPPLLPPPGPIAPSCDLTLNDAICCDSAMDSGIEYGKSSNYSSNTNPSNDFCCSIEQHMSSSAGDEQSYRHLSPCNGPLFGYYPHKDVMDSIHSYNDHLKMKSNSDLRPIQW